MKSEIEKRLGLTVEFTINPIDKENFKDVLAEISDNKATLQSMYHIVKANISKEEAEIKAEEERRSKQNQECFRNNNEYYPFLLSMLNSLGKYKVYTNVAN